MLRIKNHIIFLITISMVNIVGCQFGGIVQVFPCQTQEDCDMQQCRSLCGKGISKYPSENQPTITTGHWRLISNQNMIQDIDISQNPDTGKFFVRCMVLRLTTNDGINVEATFILGEQVYSQINSNAFSMTRHFSETLYSDITGKFSSYQKMTGTFRIVHTDQEPSDTTVTFSGSPVSPSPKDKYTKIFCQMCYETVIEKCPYET